MGGPKGTAPGCRRVHFDIPEDCYEILKAKADEPPKVSVAEYCRRIVAWKVGYPLPPARIRKENRVRLTGEPKLRTGPKPRTYRLEDGEGLPCD